MSFVIGAYDSHGVYLAADTQATHLITGEKLGSIHKIIEITDKLAIGFSGLTGHAKSIILEFQKQYRDSWTIDNVNFKLEELLISNGLLFDSVFIPSYIHEGEKYISLVMCYGGKVLISRRYYITTRYLYLISPPSDYSFDKCLQLCQTKLELAEQRPPKEVLTEIVQEIALHSNQVNNIVDFWKAELPQCRV